MAADGFGGGELLEGLLAAGMPPGVAFFLGGTLVLTMFGAMAYVQQR